MYQYIQISINIMIHACMCLQHTPLMLACTRGKPEVVKVLLRYGADVAQKEGEGQEMLNSLELAIENGRRYT